MNIKLLLHRFQRCKPLTYEPTGEIATFHWDTPLTHSQKFTVCSVCNRVKIVSESGTPYWPHQRAEKGSQFTGLYDYAKIPSNPDRMIPIRNPLKQGYMDLQDALRKAERKSRFLDDYIRTESRLIHD